MSTGLRKRNVRPIFLDLDNDASNTEAKGNVINFELRKKTWKPEGMPMGVMFVMVAFKFEIGYFDTRYSVLSKKKLYICKLINLFSFQ